MTKQNHSSNHQKEGNTENKNNKTVKQWYQYIKTIWPGMSKFLDLCKGNWEAIRKGLMLFIAIIGLGFVIWKNCSPNQQTEILYKDKAAFLEIKKSELRTVESRGKIQFILETEIVNIKTIAADDIETKSRVDLFQRDFENNNIVYEAKTSRHPPLSNIGKIILRDTIKTIYRVVEIDTTQKSVFLHINIAYHDGLDKIEVRNWGYRFNVILKDKRKCKHNE